jgi:hypothetical protein
LTAKFESELAALKTKHEAEIEALISNHRTEMSSTKLNAETNYDSDGDVDEVCDVCGKYAADEISELTYCLRCQDVLCGDCSSKCKECDDAFCSDCVGEAIGNIEGVEIPGENGRKMSVCWCCHEGGELTCCDVSLSKVPCGQVVCDDCEDEHHSGFECRSCNRERNHGGRRYEIDTYTINLCSSQLNDLSLLV